MRGILFDRDISLTCTFFVGIDHVLLGQFPGQLDVDLVWCDIKNLKWRGTICPFLVFWLVWREMLLLSTKPCIYFHFFFPEIILCMMVIYSSAMNTQYVARPAPISLFLIPLFLFIHTYANRWRKLMQPC